MERLYHMASTLRKKLFCASNKSPLESRRLDPLLRSAYIAALAAERPALQDLDAALQELEQEYQNAVQKEQFIALRIRAYQKKLRESREENAKEETNEVADLEEGPASNEPSEDYDAALAAVQATQLSLLTHCEAMRRQLQELRQKRDALWQMQEVVTAVELENDDEHAISVRNEEEEDNDDNGDIELPMPVNEKEEDDNGNVELPMQTNLEMDTMPSVDDAIQGSSREEENEEQV